MPLFLLVDLQLKLCFFFFFLLVASNVCRGQLQVGFYSNSCPSAEGTVRAVVREASNSDPTLLPALLRLHFHDCIVKGCDGSVLVKSGESNNTNHAGLRGLDVVDQAKQQLETLCPGVVSCADILALAARDAVFLTGGPPYDLPTGRRDGRTSNPSDANGVPDVHDDIGLLKSKFAAVNLTDKDLVLLSAAHTIGTTACFFVQDRLYNFNGRSNESDPTINPDYLLELKARCPPGENNVRLPLDHGSEGVFDTQFFYNVEAGYAPLRSDAVLYEDNSTRAIVESYTGLMSSVLDQQFGSDFAESMVRLGFVGVLAGNDGVIRKVCSVLD